MTVKSLEDVVKEQFGLLMFALCVKEAELNALKAPVIQPAPAKE